MVITRRYLWTPIISLLCGIGGHYVGKEIDPSVAGPFEYPGKKREGEMELVKVEQSSVLLMSLIVEQISVFKERQQKSIRRFFAPTGKV